MFESECCIVVRFMKRKKFPNKKENIPVVLLTKADYFAEEIRNCRFWHNLQTTQIESICRRILVQFANRINLQTKGFCCNSQVQPSSSPLPPHSSVTACMIIELSKA